MREKSFALIVVSFLFVGCQDTPVAKEVPSASSAGKALFDTKCSYCHTTTKPQSNAEKDKLVAPAINGVMKHMRMEFGNNDTAMKAFMKDYIVNPSKEKALCQANKIEKFGLMPSQKEMVSQTELNEIVDYLVKAY